MNRVVKYFVFADLALFTGWGFVAPVFSVFIIEEVVGATLVTVGISAALYWLARAVIQIPIAMTIDRMKGEKDDFYALILGLITISASAFLLVFIRTPLELYIVQIMQGAAFGAYSVSWVAIFSRHLDKERVAFDWSLDRATLSLAIATSSILGGVVASAFGFNTIFIASGVLSLASAVIVFFVPDLVVPRTKGEINLPAIERYHDHQSSIH